MEDILINIEQGNTALLMFQPQWDNGEAVDPSTVTGLTVKTGKRGTTLTTISHTIVGTEIAINLSAEQALGTYDIRISGTVGTFSKSNTRAVYVRTARSGGLMKQDTYHLPWVWVGSSNAEMQAAMQNLNTATAAATAAKAAADAEKAAYAQKVESIGGLAKKTDLPTDYAKAGTTAKTLDDISIDTTALAKDATVAKEATLLEKAQAILAAIAAGGGGGTGDSKWSKWVAQLFGNPEGLPAEYAELTETECVSMVDTLAGKMMHADEDGEVDYLYALQMGYPDHEFSSAEMASIKAARDEYWEEHPLEN